MIITVTLSPTIDKTVYVSDFKLGDINEMKGTREDTGGKGINVSKMIKELNGQSLATGLIGGQVGKLIIDKLAEDHIDYDFIPVNHNSRYNIKLVDETNKTFTDVNEAGGDITPEAICQLENKIFSIASEGDILVLSGRVPDSVEQTIYKKWIEIAKAKGIKTILDADKQPLKEAVIAGPYMIKPNIHELERLCDTTFNGLEDIKHHVMKLFAYGIEVILVSLGDEGAYLFTKGSIYHFEGLAVHVKSTVGAGDSMVGAMAYGMDNDYAIQDAFKLAIAASTATVQKEGTVMANLDEINNTKEKINIKTL